MSIPVYLAVNYEENVQDSKNIIAQVGFGFHPNGSVRIPQQIIPNSVAVIDDLFLPNFTASAVHLLKDKITHGCILDFERSPSPRHKKMIQNLQDRKIISLPAQFHSLSPSALPIISCSEPCNSWLQFLNETHHRYPCGWVLEITPWYHLRDGVVNKNEGYLQHALCRFRRERNKILYYDTKETLAKKMNLAEQNGCKSVIVLQSDIKKL